MKAIFVNCKLCIVTAKICETMIENEDLVIDSTFYNSEDMCNEELRVTVDDIIGSSELVKWIEKISNIPMQELREYDYIIFWE